MLNQADLQRNGFADHVQAGGEGEIQHGPSPAGRGAAAPFEPAEVDPELAAQWHAFADLAPDTLGFQVWSRAVTTLLMICGAVPSPFGSYIQ